ncbi:MAG TPA: M20 family metallopeptidase [Saprospiraceae bacterium]|nr:M20 family metallopeptidase [Saprospiraceae bacterium]
MLRDTIHGLAKKHHQQIIAIRRHLHMHPELSFGEAQTARYVQDVLKRIGIPFTTGWAGYGIVGILECQNPDHAVIALRADMDALPIQELNEVSYKSQHPGIMHACGHDVHTSSLLGAAMILSELSSKISGTIKFIFQPAEEKLPGGAALMISEGVLKNPGPTGILGQHVHPALPVGTVGFGSGQAMASSDEITIRIIGKGGHGAMPHHAVDPVAISAHVISALQSVISRMADPTVPSVLTFGKISSEAGTYNIIPDSVLIFGTFRTFNEDWRITAHEKIRAMVHGITSGMGGTGKVDIQKGYPVLINDPDMTLRCRESACEYLGNAHVHDIPQRLTSEDFAYYTHHIPGCFYRLGVSNSNKGITSPVHTPTFDIDEDALETGSGLMAWLAVSELHHG